MDHPPLKLAIRDTTERGTAVPLVHEISRVICNHLHYFSELKVFNEMYFIIFLWFVSSSPPPSPTPTHFVVLWYTGLIQNTMNMEKSKDVLTLLFPIQYTGSFL